jgi:hypothetical protein
MVFLLFSYESKKQKKINFYKYKIVDKIILENKFIKKENNYIIELYEIERSNTIFELVLKNSNIISIQIDNYELNIKLSTDELFIFNEKKDLNINCLTIEEEFKFYYEFIKKHKDKSKKYLTSLIKSTFRILEENKEHSTFSLLLTILIEEESIKFINENNYDIEKTLLKIEKKGDLPKIDKKKLDFFEENKFMKYYIIYIIFENKDELRKYIKKPKNRRLIFDVLFKYKKLFQNYINIFNDYSFLIDEVDSIIVLYNLFHFPKKLSEFIFLLNNKKEHIFDLIFEKEKGFLIQDFFSPTDDNIFNENFNESFYISLISINEYILETYKDKFIFGFKIEPKRKNFIHSILFNFFISSEIINENELTNAICKHLNNLNEYNNMEIIGLIYIINAIKNDFEIMVELFKILNNRKISDDCIKFFKTINFDKTFSDINSYENFIHIFLKFISNIKLFECLFF